MKKHPYISATIAATLLAIVVWFLMPKYYSSRTKLSDEYTETNISIGLTKIIAEKNANNIQDGINNMEVYSKILLTESFIRDISKITLSNQHQKYGDYMIADKHWWESESDTIEIIRNHFNYNYSNKEETLIIQVRDKNALTASEVLDSVTTALQRTITEKRRKNIIIALNNSLLEQQRAKKQYQIAKDSLAIFIDKHVNSSIKEDNVERERLKLNEEIALKYYNGSSLNVERNKALLNKYHFSFAVVIANTVPLNNDSHLIGYIICFVFIALILTNFAKNLYNRKKEASLNITFGDLFAPWNITISVWAVMLLLISVNNIIEPISEQFYICLALWICFFCTSSFLSYNLSKKKSFIKKDATIRVNKTVFNVLFIAAMCMTPLYVYKVYQIVTLFGPVNILSNIRELSAHGEGFGLLNLTLVIDIVLLIAALLSYPKVPLWKLSLIIIAWITYCIGTMAKGYFFMLFVFAVFVLYERKIIKVRTMAIATIVLLVFFYFFNLMRATEGSSYQENETFLDFIGMYILSGPAAFGHVMETISDKFGPNVFWAIDYYIGRFFTGNEIVHSMHKEFVYVPVLTNTYTILRPYFMDFGYWGVVMFAFVFGYSSGYVYRLSTNQNQWGKCVYCYLTFFLIMQFFDDMITEGPMQIVQIIFLLFLMVYVPPKSKKVQLTTDMT